MVITIVTVPGLCFQVSLLASAGITQNAGKVGKIKVSHGFLSFRIAVVSFLQLHRQLMWEYGTTFLDICTEHPTPHWNSGLPWGSSCPVWELNVSWGSPPPAAARAGQSFGCLLELLVFSSAWQLGKVYGVESYVLTPSQTKDLYPLMNIDDLYGTLYVPKDGTMDPAGTCSTLARAATARGATVVPN